MAEKIVRIEWQGPCCPSKIVSTEKGVYQFYGRHPCYGGGVLLYIGKTESGLGFRGRVAGSSHEFLDLKQVTAFFRPDEVKVRLGIILDYAGWSIDDIEKVLIFAHSPAWNSEYIRSLCYKQYKGLIIENIGDSGHLVRKFNIGENDIEVIKGAPAMKAKNG